MPIFAYLAVAGSALVGLLFAADALLPDRGPLSISSEFHGVAIAIQADSTGSPGRPDLEADLPGLAPAPDMKSAAIKVAREDAPQLQSVAPAAKVEPVPPVARAEATPKKRKHIARSREKREQVASRREWRQHHAQADDFGWSSNNRSSWRNNSWQNDSWQNEGRTGSLWNDRSWR